MSLTIASRRIVLMLVFNKYFRSKKKKGTKNKFQQQQIRCVGSYINLCSTETYWGYLERLSALHKIEGGSSLESPYDSNLTSFVETQFQVSLSNFFKEYDENAHLQDISKKCPNWCCNESFERERYTFQEQIFVIVCAEVVGFLRKKYKGLFIYVFY